MHTVIAYISPVWDIIVAVCQWWLQQPCFDSLEWHWQCVLTHRPRADGHRQTDRVTQGKRKRESGRESRANSAPWTAAMRHLSRQHLFAFISKRRITYSRQSQCWIRTLVPNATITAMLSQVPCWFLTLPLFLIHFSQKGFSVLQFISLTNTVELCKISGEVICIDSFFIDCF